VFIVFSFILTGTQQVLRFLEVSTIRFGDTSRRESRKVLRRSSAVPNDQEKDFLSTLRVSFTASAVYIAFQ